MSRFVRASKYRHVYGQTGKKEFSVENVKVSNQAWDTNLIAASATYISLNWQSSGGGAFGILPLPSPWGPIPHNVPYKLPDLVPLARGHTAPVLDTAWNPFNDSVVASAGEDGKVCIWQVEAQHFEGWGSENWEPIDFDPVQKIDVSPRKIGQVLFHPTASHVLAAATGEHVVKLWDLNNPDAPQTTLSGHNDTIQGLDFNSTGTLLATTSRDRKIRIFDPRVGGEAVRVGEGHSGVKGARITWMGDTGRIATTGFSKMSDRQVGVWDAASLDNLKMVSLDQSAGIVMPFWSDNGVLFLAGKGDGNIRYYEYEGDTLHSLSEHKSSDPQRGMCFLPRRALNVSECEIARAYKVISTSSTQVIEPIGFVVPRRADSFQADIFPPAASTEPTLTAAAFFTSSGEIQRKVVDLDTGATTTAVAPTPLPASSGAPPPAAVTPATPVTPTAPGPAVSTTTTTASASSSTFSTTTTTAAAAAAAKAAPLAAATLSTAFKPSSGQEYTAKDYTSSPSGSVDSAALIDENARLTGELREARSHIRSLELQLETLRANAQRAAKVLLEG